MTLRGLYEYMGSLTRPVTSCTQNRGIFKLAHALCGEAALGFPRGEAAERSEADEGWRELKPSTAIRCFVETQANATHRTAFINLPVATPHQPALPVPKCRQVRQLPPGGSQGAVAGAGFIHPTAQFSNLAGGCYPPLQLRRQSRRRVDTLVDPYSGRFQTGS